VTRLPVRRRDRLQGRDEEQGFLRSEQGTWFKQKKKDCLGEGAVDPQAVDHPALLGEGCG
jgi:hypothetical protein